MIKEKTRSFTILAKPTDRSTDRHMERKTGGLMGHTRFPPEITDIAMNQLQQNNQFRVHSNHSHDSYLSLPGFYVYIVHTVCMTQTSAMLLLLRTFATLFQDIVTHVNSYINRGCNIILKKRFAFLSFINDAVSHVVIATSFYASEIALAISKPGSLCDLYFRFYLSQWRWSTHALRQ